MCPQGRFAKLLRGAPPRLRNLGRSAYLQLTTTGLRQSKRLIQPRRRSACTNSVGDVLLPHAATVAGMWGIGGNG